MKRKLLSLLLAVALCAGLASPAFAAEPKTVILGDNEISIEGVLYETVINKGYVDPPGVSSGLFAQERTVYWVSDQAETWVTFLDGQVGELIGIDGYAVDNGEVFQEGGDWTISETEDGGPYALIFALNDEERAFSEFYDENGAYIVIFRDYCFSIGFVKSDAPATPPAADSPSSWAVEYVNDAISVGLVPETLQAKYTQATTRAEFCALAVAFYETFLGEEVGITDIEFLDTDDVNVLKMASVSVVNGISEGIFDPDGKLTREQAATMLSRLAAAVGKPLEAAAPTFNDNGSISKWATEAVGQMQALGVMGGVGDNTFAPAADYTREQSITTALRLFEALQ